jgi:deoxyribose-phosphate aldolase
MSQTYSLRNYIEQTLLRPEASFQEIQKLCEDAIENRFFGVCVNSGWIGVVTDLLKKNPREHSPTIVSVVGFPLGCEISLAKAFEAESAINLGAQEIDMVLCTGRLKSGDLDYVKRDIGAVVSACGNHPVKVIIETHLLSDAEKSLAAKLVVDSGARFVKTCTGFMGGSATVKDIEIIKSAIGNSAGIKASGGIKDVSTAIALINAGAQRLGTSSGVALVTSAEITGGY